MILFTSGFPYAGKTEFTKMLCEHLGRELLIHINPKDLYPDDFEDLSDEEKTSNGVVAWEMSYEKTEECLDKLPNKALIIFDTCCRDVHRVSHLFSTARVKEHNVLFAYVNASFEKRQQYAEGKDISKFEERYSSSFRKDLPNFREMSDHFIIIDNNKNLSDLDKQAASLAQKIVELRS